MELDKMTPLEDSLQNPQPPLTPPVEKPPLPPEAMLTPPPRNPMPSYLNQTPVNPQPVPPQTPPPISPQIPPQTPPAQAPQLVVPEMQPLTQPEAPRESLLTPPQPAPQPAIPGIQPVNQPVLPREPLLTPPARAPQQAAPDAQPVNQQAPQTLTPPAPTVPNNFPEDGFRQPSITGQAPFQPQYGGPTTPKDPVSYASDYERILALPPISKQEAESCRHSHEKRWYRRLIELNVLLIVSVLIMFVAHFNHVVYEAEDFSAHFFAEFSADSDAESETDTDDEKSEKEKYLEKREQQRQEAEYMEDFQKYMPTEIKWLIGGIASIVILFISMYLNFAQVKAASLKITQKNFPEIYSLLHSYAYRLGMEKVPEMYVVQQSGVLNAFSSFIFGRQYILVHTEIFEVAYREHKDLNALAFILAHELSHIYYGHATLHYNLPILFSQSLPLVGSIASRTREYSCDRLAQRLTNYDGVQAIVMLMVDRHLYPMVDVQDYVDTTIKERGFWLWLVNLLASHPILPKRIRALIQWNGSGELY